MRNLILRVLDEHDGFCLDLVEERELLADYLAEALAREVAWTPAPALTDRDDVGHCTSGCNETDAE